MRYTTEIVPVSNSITTTGYNPYSGEWGDPYEVSRVDDLLVNNFVRDDVRKSLVGKDGFRPPLPYMSYGEEFTPYSGTSTSLKHDMWGRMQTKVEHTFTQTRLPSYLFPEARPTPFNERNKTLLINNAFIKLKEQEMNLAMTLAFIPQTAGLITDYASRLRRAYLFIKRGRWKAAADVLGLRYGSDLRSNYLAILFGWMQLSRDLIGAAEMLSDLSRPKGYYVYGRSKNEKERKVTKVTSPYLWSPPCVVQCEATIKMTQKVVVIGHVTSEGLHTFKRSGFLNPALIAWDVVRWTWVLDQFVSIGQYLNAYDAVAGLDYRGGSYTSFTESRGTLTPTVNPDDVDPWGYKTSWKLNSSVPCVFRWNSLERSLVNTTDIGVVLKNPFDMDIKIALAAVLALANVFGKQGPFDHPFGGARS